MKWLYLLLAGSLIWACGEGDDRPPAWVGDEDGGSGAESPGRGGRQGNGRGGDEGEAGQGGIGGEGSNAGGGAPASGEGGVGNVGHIGGLAGELNSAGAPTFPEPECDADATWEVSSLIASVNSDPEDDRLLGVTPDELTLILAREGELWIADRASKSNSFEPPVSVPVPGGYDVTLGAALSPDGLRVIVVADDGRAFGELRRPDRASAFADEVDEAPFAAINGATVFSGATLATPVLAASDQTLYFTQRVGVSFVHVSSRQGSDWDVGVRIDPYTLAGSTGFDKLVTGISPDELTIFMLDELVGHVVAFWRQGTSSPFYTPIDFEGTTAVQATEGCSTLYASVEGDHSLDLGVLTRK